MTSAIKGKNSLGVLFGGLGITHLRTQIHQPCVDTPDARRGQPPSHRSEAGRNIIQCILERLPEQFPSFSMFEQGFQTVSFSSAACPANPGACAEKAGIMSRRITAQNRSACTWSEMGTGQVQYLRMGTPHSPIRVDPGLQVGNGKTCAASPAKDLPGTKAPDRVLDTTKSNQATRNLSDFSRPDQQQPVLTSQKAAQYRPQSRPPNPECRSRATSAGRRGSLHTLCQPDVRHTGKDNSRKAGDKKEDIPANSQDLAPLTG